MKRILVATDFSTRAHRAVRRAGILSRQTGAELTLLHIVDEESEHLVALEVKESLNILEEQIDSIEELREVRCRPAVTTGAAHDAILKMAHAASSDLIVMGSHRKQLLRDVFVGTTIERVVREGPFPVLMVNTEAALPYHTLLAALDMSEASAQALRAAQKLGFLKDVRRIVVHAFYAMAKSKLALADVPSERIAAYVEEERSRADAELKSFIEGLEIEVGAWSPYVEEGDAVPVISQAIDAVRPDILLIGTHGRTGLSKLFLGSVAEQLLRSLEVDILAVGGK